jgi:pyruvate dehydrogenase E2 component (dihydrolipoamide acetyltransferase)
MAVPIMIPSSGELGSEVTLVRWLAQPGDSLSSGAPVAEIEADKGVLEVEVPSSGTVLAIYFPEGATVPPGTILGYLGEPGEAVPDIPGSSSTAPQTPPSAVEAGRSARGAADAPGPPIPVRPAESVLAAPATRRLAAALEVDLNALTPTGAGGIVTRRDVEDAAADASRRGTAVRRAATQGAEAGDDSPGAAVTNVLPGAESGRLLSPNQRTVANRVSRSHREIPPAHFTAEVDARRAVALRSQGMSYTALFVFAAGRGLARFPRFRSALQGERLVTARAAHVAFAVGLEEEGELYTPVVRDVGSLDLKTVDAQVRELAAAVRGHRLSPESFAGGSFLVTNLGRFPVESFDPVIYPGHSGALAVGAVRFVPVAVQEQKGWQVEIRPTVSLTLAVDHRLINGLEAAAFLSFVKEVVEGGFGEGGHGP